MDGDVRGRADIAIAVRTLIAAGYSIIGSATQPRHEEVSCLRQTSLGADVRMLIAFTGEETLDPEELTSLRRAANGNNQSLLVVSENPTDDSVSWDNFYRALGGEVPSWRALLPGYSEALLATARNKLPPGVDRGEAWFLFESMASDGFEFVLGRRARHLGGVKRGARVGDILAQLPDGRALVIDAKATGGTFDARMPELRALGEYVVRQITRQYGQDVVHAAVVISSAFQQGEQALGATALEFLAEYHVPVAFITAETLAKMVKILSVTPLQRNALRWARLFRGGVLSVEDFKAEFAAAHDERLPVGP